MIKMDKENDLIRVIRCKNCIYFNEVKGWGDLPDEDGICSVSSLSVTKGGYCHFARESERRGNDDT